MKALISKLDEEGRRWGFEMQVKPKFGSTFSHRFHANGRNYMSFIVNKNSLLFYFRKPLLNVVKNFERLIVMCGLPHNRNSSGEYTVQITDERLCSDVIQFIDSQLIEKLGLKASQIERTTKPATSSENRSSSEPETRFTGESDLEGLVTEVVRFQRKRSRKLRDLAFQQANGVCCVCERDFSKLLGGRGMRVLQVHHRDQLAARDEPTLTTVSDLAVVCANCHLLLHLDANKALNVDELRNLLWEDGHLSSGAAT